MEAGSAPGVQPGWCAWVEWKESFPVLSPSCVPAGDPGKGVREQPGVEGHPCNFASFGLRYGEAASALRDNHCLTLWPGVIV